MPEYADLNQEAQRVLDRLRQIGRPDCIRLLEGALPARSVEDLERLSAVLLYIIGEIDESP